MSPAMLGNAGETRQNGHNGQHRRRAVDRGLDRDHAAWLMGLRRTPLAVEGFAMTPGCIRCVELGNRSHASGSQGFDMVQKEQLGSGAKCQS